MNIHKLRLIKCKHLRECNQKVSYRYFVMSCLGGHFGIGVVKDECFKRKLMDVLDPAPMRERKLPREWIIKLYKEVEENE